MRRSQRKLLRLASDSLFREAPLPGVGSDAWRRLWEAARAYSDQVAYPGRTFPAPVEDERCVLCQQPLGVDGLHRHAEFETVVKGAAQKAAADAVRELEDYRQELGSARMPIGRYPGACHTPQDGTRPAGIGIGRAPRRIDRSMAASSAALRQRGDRRRRRRFPPKS